MSCAPIPLEAGRAPVTPASPELEQHVPVCCTIKRVYCSFNIQGERFAQPVPHDAGKRPTSVNFIWRAIPL